MVAKKDISDAEKATLTMTGYSSVLPVLLWHQVPTERFLPGLEVDCLK